MAAMPCQESRSGRSGYAAPRHGRRSAAPPQGRGPAPPRPLPRRRGGRGCASAWASPPCRASVALGLLLDAGEIAHRRRDRRRIELELRHLDFRVVDEDAFDERLFEVGEREAAGERREGGASATGLGPAPITAWRGEQRL